MNSKIGKAKLYLETFFTEIFSSCTIVKMSAYFNMDGTLRKENWGDDINYWFLREICKNKIVSYDWSLCTRYTDRPYIMGIGSLLTLVPLNNSIVWGTGVMSSFDSFNGKPREVRAVRGPLTRKRLLEAGIPCPKIYGDPALLLPIYYKPKVKRTYRLGVIPHYKDKNSSVFDKFKADSNVLMIDIQNYTHWLDFINQINQCDAIASTSLHGLIVSEAYGIPNLWIKLDKNMDDIKYHDFFLSIGKDRTAYVISEKTNICDIENAVKNYSKGNIDLAPLIGSCPFTLKQNVNIEYGKGIL